MRRQFLLLSKFVQTHLKQELTNVRQYAVATSTNIGIGKTGSATNRFQLKSSENGAFLEIHNSGWTKPLHLHSTWLRDHCRCPKCYDELTGHKMVDIAQVGLNVKPKHVEIGADQLLITWPDDHKTVYDVDWLSKNVYSGYKDNCRPKRKLSGKCIDSISLENDIVKYDDYMNSEEALRTALNSFVKKGYAIVHDRRKRAERILTAYRATDLLMKSLDSHVYINTWTYEETRLWTFGKLPSSEPAEQVPQNLQSTLKVTERIAPLRLGYFGRILEHSGAATLHGNFQPSPNTPLSPHTDQSYLTEPAGLKVFHCLNTKAHMYMKLVDGFYVAEELKRTDPEAYATLSEIPLLNEYTDDALHHKCYDTILKHDKFTGTLQQIRYNMYYRSSMSTLPFESMDRFYSALHAFSQLVHDRLNHLKIMPVNGTMLLIDNWRTMSCPTQHGEESLRIASCYVGWTDYMCHARRLGVVP